MHLNSVKYFWADYMYRVKIKNWLASDYAYALELGAEYFDQSTWEYAFAKELDAINFSLGIGENFVDFRNLNYVQKKFLE